MAGIHIGISGWRYAPWRGDFYPKGLTQKKELRFASRAVSSIEIMPNCGAAVGGFSRHPLFADLHNAIFCERRPRCRHRECHLL